MTIKQNIEFVQNNINQYKTASAVKLIAVTKTVDISAIKEVVLTGTTDVAENRVSSLIEKQSALKDDANIKWHFIGNIQSNKAKKIVLYSDYIHSIDSLKIASIVDNYAKELNKIPKILLEVNISKEKNKHGFDLVNLIENIPSLAKLKNIDIIGLMTMAPYGAEEKELRKIFEKLRELREKINNMNVFKHKFTELSMGMSDDYCIALQEGATMIRIGSALFQ